jgi:hypothetical protein
LVASEGVVASRVLPNVEAYMTPSVAAIDQYIAKGRLVCLDSELAPVQCPQRVFDYFRRTSGSVHDNRSVESAPRNVVISIAYDGNSILVEFVPPPNDGLVASFANDLLNPVEFKSSLDTPRQKPLLVQPLIFSRERSHLYYQ